MTRFTGICELVLEAEDTAAMVAFYERLGLRVASEEGERTWLEVDHAARIGIWPPGENEHRDRGGCHVHFALSVDSATMDALPERLGDLGTEVEGPAEHDGGDRSFYLFDPAGNRVELWDYLDHEADLPGT